MPGIVWLKVTDPDARPPLVAPGTDLRVLLPDSGEFVVTADRFSAAGARPRRVKYLLEDEVITATREHQEVISRACGLARPYGGTWTTATEPAARAARDAFALMWRDGQPVSPASAGETAEAATTAAETALPPRALVPPEMAALLPYHTLTRCSRKSYPRSSGTTRTCSWSRRLARARP